MLLKENVFCTVVRKAFIQKGKSLATPSVKRVGSPVQGSICLGVAILALGCFAQNALAQDQAPASQPGNQTSTSTTRLPPPPTIDANVNRNLTLADVRYDNKYDVYGGVGFFHANAGPQLLQGSNLGGFDVQGTRWLTPRIGATANIRGYYGTNGVQPNPYGVRGPFIMEHYGLGGVSYRVKTGKPAALIVHGLFGGSYGSFDSDLGNLPAPGVGPVPPAAVGFFNNGGTFAMALGGSIDLNRSPQLAFRISPDYVYTRFGGVTQNEVAVSVGIIYRLKFPKGAFRPHN